MNRPRILDLALERAAARRRDEAAAAQVRLEAQRPAALAIRDSFMALLGEADPTYPAAVSALHARPLTDKERAEIDLADDPQDGAVVLFHDAARVIVRVTRAPGRPPTVRWRIYGGAAPLETTYPYGQGAHQPAIGQELWDHLLDALAQALERPVPAASAVT